MSEKIIGVTVGTPLNPDKIKEKLNPELTSAVENALKEAKEKGEFDYRLTPSDKTEIAEMAAELVDVPDSGGNVAYDEAQNLTDEQKEQARENIGAQPAGNYLTEVPEGYAKTEDIPSLEGYAKTEDIPTDEHIIDLIEENAPESSGGISVTGATVGQTVKISAVDENGVPTAWESVDFPSGGGSAKGTLFLDGFTEVASYTLQEDTKFIQDQELGGVFQEVLIKYENLWDVEGTTNHGIDFDFNGKSVASGSFRYGAFIHTSQYPSSGYAHFIYVGENKVYIIFNGANSSGHNNGSGFYTAHRPQIGEKNGFETASFALKAYGTHTMNAGAKISFYVR